MNDTTNTDKKCAGSCGATHNHDAVDATGIHVVDVPKVATTKAERKLIKLADKVEKRQIKEEKKVKKLNKRQIKSRLKEDARLLRKEVARQVKAAAKEDAKLRNGDKKFKGQKTGRYILHVNVGKGPRVRCTGYNSYHKAFRAFLKVVAGKKPVVEAGVEDTDTGVFVTHYEAVI